MYAFYMSLEKLAGSHIESTFTIWRSHNHNGAVVITTAQLHSTKPELRLGFAVVRISENGPGWK